MLPSSVVVLALATVVSAPFFPFAHAVVTAMGGLDVVMTGLAVIAPIGLTLGRDVAAPEVVELESGRGRPDHLYRLVRGGSHHLAVHFAPVTDLRSCSRPPHQ